MKVHAENYSQLLAGKSSRGPKSLYPLAGQVPLEGGTVPTGITRFEVYKGTQENSGFSHDVEVSRPSFGADRCQWPMQPWRAESLVMKGARGGRQSQQGRTLEFEAPPTLRIGGWPVVFSEQTPGFIWSHVQTSIPCQ
ncbi:hypothetical protein KM043_013696 [Ampulex compressa]|nr:hypothetical protein KM043_013696 [Ampulex compressa]